MSYHGTSNFGYNPIQSNVHVQLDRFSPADFDRAQIYPQKPNEDPQRPFIPSTHSQYSTNKLLNKTTYVRGWPNEPRFLRRSKLRNLGTVCYDVLSVLAPIPFLVLAIIAVRQNGRVIDETDWNKIQIAMSAVGRFYASAGPLLTCKGSYSFSHRVCRHSGSNNDEYIGLEAGTRHHAWIARTIHG